MASYTWCRKPDFDRRTPALVSLDISGNAFTGSLDVKKLPPSISCVNVSGNKFHGTLSFDSLPGSLETLELANNDFRGSIPLEVLPKSLLLLVITKNSFSGRLETHKGPEKLEVKGVLSNNFYEMQDTMTIHGKAAWGWQEEKGKGEEKAQASEKRESKPGFAWGSDFRCDAAPKFNWSWKPATEDKPEEEAKPLGNDPEKPMFQWTLPDNALRGKKDTENESKPKFKWTLD